MENDKKPTQTLSEIIKRFEASGVKLIVHTEPKGFGFVGGVRPKKIAPQLKNDKHDR